VIPYSIRQIQKSTNFCERKPKSELKIEINLAHEEGGRTALENAIKTAVLNRHGFSNVAQRISEIISWELAAIGNDRIMVFDSFAIVNLSLLIRSSMLQF